MDLSDDPVVRELRARITENDRAILEAVNRRVELVSELKAHKLARGYDLVDRSREDWLVDHLAAANHGPLSEAGLRELAMTLIALTKREVAIEGGRGERG